MREAGCLGMQYSLESADKGILSSMKKNVLAADFQKQTRLFHQAGIATWTSLVLGYPQETRETINNTFEACIASNIYPSVGYLLPQPGSPMYDYALENGYIDDEETYLLSMGDRQDLRINMTNIPNDEFKTLVVNHLERCNQKLNVGLKLDELIKTKHFRVPGVKATMSQGL